MGEIAPLTLMSETEHMSRSPERGQWRPSEREIVTRLHLHIFSCRGHTCARDVQIGPAAPEVAVDLVESDWQDGFLRVEPRIFHKFWAVIFFQLSRRTGPGRTNRVIGVFASPPEAFLKTPSFSGFVSSFLTIASAL